MGQLAEITLTSEVPGAPRRSVFFAGPENRLIATALPRMLPGSPAPQTPCAGICTIWGPSGTGKSHLLNGICRSWQKRFGEPVALYLTAADFRHGLCEAISSQSVPEWRRRLRMLRVLALDDIHRMPPDAFLNEELIHLFDALVENGSLILVVSKEPPSCTPNLSAALVDRLCSGLVVPLTVAGSEARAAFAAQVSRQFDRPLSPEEASLVAERTSGGLNELASAVAELTHGPNRPASLTREAITRFFEEQQHQRRPEFSDILRVVAKYYGVSQKVLKGSCRRQSVVLARAMVIYLARRLGGMSYQQIGRGLSGRDHTTIMHSCRKTEALAEHDRATQQAIDDLQRLLSIP